MQIVIASDVDGTLLHRGETRIADEVFEAIEFALAHNVIFVVASGRDYSSLKQLFYPYRDSIYFISTNGGQIIYQEEILFEANMPIPSAKIIVEEVKEQENLPIVISTNEGSGVFHGDLAFYEMLRGLGNKVQQIEKVEDIRGNIFKIGVFCPDGALAVNRRIAAKYAHLSYPTVAGDRWLDFNASDKGHTLEKLVDLLGLEQENVYAFGDQYNDLGMLDYARHPYLHEGALQELLDKGYPTTHNVSEEIKSIVRRECSTN